LKEEVAESVEDGEEEKMWQSQESLKMRNREYDSQGG